MIQDRAIDLRPFGRGELAEGGMAVDGLRGVIGRKAEQRGDAIALEIEHREEAQQEAMLGQRPGLGQFEADVRRERHRHRRRRRPVLMVISQKCQASAPPMVQG